jgi:uncharacterized membrane protein YeiH
LDIPFDFDVFTLASWIGGVAFALSGFLVGVRKNFDIMGVFILAFLTANGGGVLRDVLIGRTPLVLTDLSGFIIVVMTFFLGVGFYYAKRIDIERRGLFVLCDSLGLVAFSLTGTLVGMEAGLSIFGVCVLSFITAAGGGILRDLVVNDVPAIFKSDFYGSVAILVALVVYGLSSYGLDSELHILGVFAGALCLRMLAHRMRWHLPQFKL